MSAYRNTVLTLALVIYSLQKNTWNNSSVISHSKVKCLVGKRTFVELTVGFIHATVYEKLHV